MSSLTIQCSQLAKRAFSLEPEVEAFDEQQTVSVQVEEKGFSVCLLSKLFISPFALG